MEKSYEVYYEPEGDIIEFYHKCSEEDFNAWESLPWEMTLDIPETDLELGILISEDGKEIVHLICEISKMSAYSPRLLNDIWRIPRKGQVFFSLRCGDKCKKETFELSKEQIDLVTNFMET